MPDAAGYDAFLSYSHALDGRLAPTLQAELQRFAKPWYRLRALRVFRDDASLSANPGLWTSIEQALAASTWLVVLASPEAAASQWIEREIRWWLENRSPDRLLLVITSGEFEWDEAAQDVDWTRSTAAPPALHGAFREEPRWVDLRWLHDAEQADRSHPRLRENVADIAAAVRGVPKDRVIGEHVRHHRMTMRVVRATVTAMAVLLVVALVAGVVAGVQRNEAVRQAEIATGRLLASASNERLATRLDLAQLLAVQAHRRKPGPESQAALLRAVTATPELVRYLHAGSRITDQASRGRFVVAATADGRLMRWPLDGGDRVEIGTGLKNLRQVALSVRGDRVAATDGKSVLVHDVRSGETLTLPTASRTVERIAISPGGRVIAVHAESPEIALFDASNGDKLRSAESPLPTSELLTVTDDWQVVVGDGAGGTASGSLAAEHPALISTQQRSPKNNYAPAYSNGGEFYGFVKFDQFNIFPGGPWVSESIMDGTTLPLPTNAVPEAQAIASDGRAAVASAGVVTVGDPAGEAVELPGNSRIDSLEFADDDRHLTGVAGESLVLWDLDQGDRLAGRPLGEVEDPFMSVGPPELTISPEGDRALVAPSPGGSEMLHVDLRSRAVARFDTGFSYDASAWTDDGVALIDPEGDSAVVAEDDPARIKEPWPRLRRPMAGSVTATRVDGDRVVLVDGDGRIVVRALSDGDVLRDLGTRGWPSSSPYALRVSAVNQDGSRVALADERSLVEIDVDSGTAKSLSGGGVEGITYAPSGELLVQRREGPVELWAPDGDRPERTLDASDLAAGTLTASPDGRLAAGIRDDGGIVLLDMGSGRRIGVLAIPPPQHSMGGETGQVSTVAFGAGSDELISATSGGKLLRWPLDAEEWERRACAAAGRSLTQREWHQVTGLDALPDLAC